jgi:hypothetical protein
MEMQAPSTGARLIALLRAHPSLRGTLVELPGPASER